MSLKIKALVQLITVILFAIISMMSIEWILANVARETLVNAVGFGFMGMLFYFAYEIILARLESQETLKKIEEDLKK